MPEHLRDSRTETTVVVQIEDLAALEQVDAIAKVDGVDCLFIGRVDLAVALGTTPDAPEVVKAVEEICHIASKNNKAVGMFTPRVDEVAHWRNLGASFFLLGSEQAFIIQGANQLVASFEGQLSV